MTDQYDRITPLSREWFEHLLRMIDLEACGIPGLTVEQAMAELDPHLPRIAAALTAAERVRGEGPVLDREAVEKRVQQAASWRVADLQLDYVRERYDEIVAEHTDAIMAMAPRPVLDREKVEDALREAHRRGRASGKSGDTTPYTLCDLNDAIMAHAKSEAEVRRDERERLAQAAQGAIVVEDDFGMPMLSALPDWLRSQGGAS